MNTLRTSEYSNALLTLLKMLFTVKCRHLNRFPKLRLLDFRKIRQKDRQAAIELFRSKKGKDILKEIAKKAKASAANPIAAESNSSKGIPIIRMLLALFIHLILIN